MFMRFPKLFFPICINFGASDPFYFDKILDSGSALKKMNPDDFFNKLKVFDNFSSSQNIANLTDPDPKH